MHTFNFVGYMDIKTVYMLDQVYLMSWSIYSVCHLLSCHVVVSYLNEQYAIDHTNINACSTAQVYKPVLQLHVNYSKS